MLAPERTNKNKIDEKELNIFEGLVFPDVPSNKIYPQNDRNLDLRQTQDDNISLRKDYSNFQNSETKNLPLFENLVLNNNDSNSIDISSNPNIIDIIEKQNENPINSLENLDPPNYSLLYLPDVQIKDETLVYPDLPDIDFESKINENMPLISSQSRLESVRDDGSSKIISELVEENSKLMEEIKQLRQIVHNSQVQYENQNQRSRNNASRIENESINDENRVPLARPIYNEIYDQNHSQPASQQNEIHFRCGRCSQWNSTSREIRLINCSHCGILNNCQIARMNHQNRQTSWEVSINEFLPWFFDCLARPFQSLQN